MKNNRSQGSYTIIPSIFPLDHSGSSLIGGDRNINHAHMTLLPLAFIALTTQGQPAKAQALANTLYIRNLHQFLTTETFKTAIWLYRLAAIIHCVPFALESGSRLCVKMFSSKWRMLLWHLVNWIYYLQTAFLVATFVIALTTEPFGEQLVLHLIYIVSALFGFVFMLSCYLKPQACVIMLNKHDFILRKTEGKDQLLVVSSSLQLLSISYFRI